MKRQTGKNRIPCQCLDFVEVVHRHRVYPLMYCHMELFGHLDISRLKQSVSLSSKIIPEVLCAYDFKKGGFVSLGYTADDAVKYAAELSPSLPWQDLSLRPQVQVLITPKEDHDLVMVVMSHILADGAGFLQYLYLLAALYNGRPLDKSTQNTRDISPLLENIRLFAPAERSGRNRPASVPPLRSAENGRYLFCLTSQLPADSMAIIRQKAKGCGATLNDSFMTSYARVIARLQNINTVVLSCPADLRKFYPESNALTVANMTGIYRRVAVEMPPGCSFNTALRQVHDEMALQKSQYRCFAGIKVLNGVFHKMPNALLARAIKATYRLSPVSYTNFGTVDHDKLFFQDCAIQNCFFTGTYRLPPDFQLTVSTFRNRCTFNCALIGAAHDGKTGQYILDQVKCELLKWIEN